jgi:hypothetical protein
MQLQTVLCCTYSMIFITAFEIKQIRYIAPRCAPRPQGKILVAHLPTMQHLHI